MHAVVRNRQTFAIQGSDLDFLLPDICELCRSFPGKYTVSSFSLVSHSLPHQREQNLQEKFCFENGVESHKLNSMKYRTSLNNVRGH